MIILGGGGGGGGCSTENTSLIDRLSTGEIEAVNYIAAIGKLQWAYFIKT